MSTRIGKAFLFIMLLLLLRCSQTTNITGGNGSETTNGILSLRVVAASGEPAAEARVAVVPYSFNPGKDSFPGMVFFDTADAQGLCSLAIPRQGKYNVLVQSRDRATQALVSDVWVLKDFPVKDTILLSTPGFIQILLPDTVDTMNGYVFVKGTLMYKPLRTKTTLAGGYVSLIIDSVPAAVLPPLEYDVAKQNTNPFVLAQTLDLHENDTFAFALTASNMTKPVWRFRLLVAVKEGIVQYCGGLSNVKQLVATQLNEVNRRFNKPSVLSGVMQFFADSVYEYSGKMMDEGSKSYQGFLCRLLYENNLTTEVPAKQGKIKRPFYIYDIAKAADIFQDPSTGVITALLGWTRGCPPFEMFDVDSAKNPISRQSFVSAHAIQSFMSTPLDYSHTIRMWDAYSKGIMNANADKVGSEITIVNTTFCDILGVRVLSGATPLSGVTIAVYASRLSSSTVDNTAIVSGKTNNKGIFVFSQNPFMPDTASAIVNGNLVIRASLPGDTVCAWFPLYEAGIAFFTQTESTYLKEIRF